MPINFTQTDTDNNIGNTFCSGRSVSSSLGKLATDGGTAGTGTGAIQVDASLTTVVSFNFKCTVNSGVSWNAGTWTWRLNITTANMNLTLGEVYLCRVNSSDVNQATIGSATGLGISLSSTGVKSGTISGSSQSPSAGDYVSVVLVFTNTAMTGQQADCTLNQNIDSPFTAAAGIPNKIVQLNQSVKRASYW